MGNRAESRPVSEFGRFRLNAAERLLTRDGQPVSLTPKAFDLLVFLVERQGKLVEKSTLMAALWPDTIVEEANLAFQVSAVRKALGDGGEGDGLIQTVPTKGYRFIGEVTRRTPDASRPAPSGTRRPALWFAAGAVTLLALLMSAYLLTRANVRSPTAGPTQAPVRLLPVTTLTGWQDGASLSPDGEQVAFEWADNRSNSLPILARMSSTLKRDIYVTIIGSRDVRRLTTHPAADFAPSWSPNGREIAFLRSENDVTRVHVMSALGGADRTVGNLPAWPSINWSPDARFIVFGRVAEHEADRGIYVMPTSGGPPRAIEALRAPAAAYSPAFSPDGHRLAYVICENVDFAESYTHSCHVMLVDVDEAYVPRGTPRQLTSEPMSGIGTLSWLRDGRTLVFSGDPARSSDGQSSDSDEFAGHLWRISLDGPRTPERIEVAGFSANNPTTSMTRDRLVFSRYDQDADVFRLIRGGEPQRLLSSATLDVHAQFSADGRRIAFASDRTGGLEIWIADADGSSERQLTHGPTLYQGSPRWSPDGSLIAFDAQEADGDRHIWVIPSEGGAARQLTNESGDQSAPTWSRDGQWIYYTKKVGGQRHVWRVPTPGGSPQRISSAGSGVIAFESPDGQHVIYKLGPDDGPLVEEALTGDGLKTLVRCVTSDFGFSVVRESVYYQACAPAKPGTVRVLDMASGRDALWGVVPDGESAFLWDPAISPDGTSLLYNKFPNFSAHLSMLENFK